ncbi:MAG: helix-turn-helix domain-containing protein [Dehalococcoidia bacterium]
MTKQQARSFRVTIGQRLRDQRIRLGLTQEDLAWEAGISQGSVSHYEQGKIEIPLSVLLDLCRALRISPVLIVPGLVPGTSTTESDEALAGD